MEIERALCLLYNAICLGELEERYDHNELLRELGMTEEEWKKVME